MRVLMTGSTGMVGSEVLKICQSNEKITQIVSLSRKKEINSHPKTENILIQDFETYDGNTEVFAGVDVAFFCLGAYTGSVPDELFKKVTVDFAVQFAKLLSVHSPRARLCLLSGAGADRTEKSRTSFARYKGMAENQISDLGMAFHSFRPGYIYPVTARKEPNIMYSAMRWLYPALKLLLGQKVASNPPSSLKQWCKLA